MEKFIVILTIRIMIFRGGRKYAKEKNNYNNILYAAYYNNTFCKI